MRNIATTSKQLLASLLIACLLAPSAFAGGPINNAPQGGTFNPSTDRVFTIRNNSADAVQTTLGSAATQSMAAFLQPGNNLSDIGSASAARSNLGLGTAATQDIAAFLSPANNLSDITNAASARLNLGLGTASVLNATGILQPVNNLSDVVNATTALNNLLPAQTGHNGQCLTTNATNTSWGACGSGSAVSVTGSSPNIIISPTPGTGTFTIGTADVINAQGTAASYTVLSTDMAKTVTHTKSTAVAVTLPQAGTTGFEAGKSYSEVNLGAGIATVTPTTSTINGNASYPLHKYGWLYGISDGSNYVGIGIPGFDTITGGALMKFTADASGASTAAVAGTDYQAPITLTTTGTSGAATLVGSTLNIPNYAGGGGSSSAFAVQPSSTYTSDTAGNLFPYVYTGAGGNASAHEAGWGVAASLAASPVLEMRFPMPSVIPSGTAKLLSTCIANASSGVMKYTVSDANVASGSNPSSASLTSETQNSLTFTAADTYLQAKTTLTATPTANGTLVVAVTFNATGYTLAAIGMCRHAVIWE